MNMGTPVLLSVGCPLREERFMWLHHVTVATGLPDQVSQKPFPKEIPVAIESSAELPELKTHDCVFLRRTKSSFLRIFFVEIGVPQIRIFRSHSDSFFCCCCCFCFSAQPWALPGILCLQNLSSDFFFFLRKVNSSCSQSLLEELKKQRIHQLSRKQNELFLLLTHTK